MSVISGATIAPALPGIEAHFAHYPYAPLLARLVFTAPALAIAIMAPVVGIIIDRTGRRNLLLFAVLLFGLAGMSGLILNDLFSLIGSRIILGFAVAATMTISTALIGDYYAGEDRARFFGLQTAMQGITGLVFTVLGGILAEIDWRTTFTLYAFALLILPGVYRFLPEPNRANDRSASEVSSVQQQGDPQSTYQSHDASQQADRTAAKRKITGLYSLAFFNSICFFLVPTQIPFLLRDLGTTSPTLAGVAIGVTTVFMTLSSLQYQRLRGRFGTNQIFALGLGIMAIGFIILGAANHSSFVFVGAAIIGGGMGVFTPNLIMTIMAAASEQSRGRVASGMTSSLFLGQFVSPIIIYPVLAVTGASLTFIFVAAAQIGIAAILLIGRMRVPQAN